MRIAAGISLVLTVFVLAWRFRLSFFRAASAVICALGLVSYVLAFFGGLPLLGVLVTAGGAASLGAVVLRCRREGPRAAAGELRRQVGSPFFWVCLALLAGAALCLRQEQILEWDGYNFWGPDIKSLYYRGGYAPPYSNPAFKFGNYTPLFQLVLSAFARLMGSYQERWLFVGYYLWGSVMLFSVAELFVARAQGRARLAASLIAPVCAVLLPGLACTTWYRAFTVDPIMAILFGTVLSRAALPPGEEKAFSRVELPVLTGALALMKSIGVVWALLAALFTLLWQRRDPARRRLAGGMALGAAALAGSWVLYCRGTHRTAVLTSSFGEAARRRLAELQNGVFLSSGNNRGFLTAYAKAFFTEPIHREWTWALDLTPFALVALMFLLAVLLRRAGLIPRGRLGRLLAFMGGTLALIYAVVVVGQLTMFYQEGQYLNSLPAVTLLTRYASPAHIGLLMLLATLAAGEPEDPPAGGKKPALAPWLGAALAVLILVSVPYRELRRRFVFDELDPQRIQFRQSLEEAYAPLARAAAGLPLDQPEVRILVGLGEEDVMNPVVINFLSPISMDSLVLPGEGASAPEELEARARETHCGYLYLQSCPEETARLLAERTGVPVEAGVLYRLTLPPGGGMALSPGE